MKKIIIFCAAVLALGACSNNDYLSTPVSEETRSTFEQMYPGAKSVEWEKRGIYRAAMFNYSGDKLTAWYSQEGVWTMTEKRMDYAKAPAKVTNAFATRSGRSNTAEHVDILTRDGIEDIYVVPEGTGSDVSEYYFSKDGILVKVLSGDTRVYDDYRNEIVPQIPSHIYTTTEYLYPGARVMEVDVIFPGILYLYVIDSGTLKILEFSLTGAWSMTTWEVTKEYVASKEPQVYEAFKELGYNDSTVISSIDCCESASITFYWFRIQNNGTETNVKITEEGKLIAIS